MTMLKKVRKTIVNKLWETYKNSTMQMKLIEEQLTLQGIHQLFLDHFAIIDLPGPNTGIPQLKQIFSAIGYVERGKDYLPEKQNDFLWMSESDCMDVSALDALPQVVVADFRIDELPLEIKKIVLKYSQKAKPFPFDKLGQLSQEAERKNGEASQTLTQLILNYLTQREWDLPSMSEFHTVHEFNELLAWVLVFGRRPNHFTLAIHLMDYFTSHEAFHDFIANEVQIPLYEKGVIKGGKEKGISQSSTQGKPEAMQLLDGQIHVPTSFVEFVWRYPKTNECNYPPLWNDFFTGFIATHANRVIESLYTK